MQVIHTAMKVLPTGRHTFIAVSPRRGFVQGRKAATGHNPTSATTRSKPRPSDVATHIATPVRLRLRSLRSLRLRVRALPLGGVMVPGERLSGSWGNVGASPDLVRDEGPRREAWAFVVGGEVG